MNVDEAVRVLNANAGSTSTGACAKYVRWALEAGGVSTAGHPQYAKDYGPFLVSKGFVRQPATAVTTPRKGDLVVLQPPDEDGAGHVEMYNGKQWVSDFKQRDFWAGPSFRNQVSYEVYRWVEKPGAGTKAPAHHATK